MNMEERLGAVMTNVGDWLKFGEAKLAAIVALDGAAIFGALQILSDAEKDGQLMRFYLQIFLCFAAAAVIVGIIGVLPRTSLPWKNEKTLTSETDNLLFFGHIAKYRPQEYLEALAAAVGETKSQWTRFERDYASQIIVNSQIASTKYRLFRWSAWLTLVAAVTPVLALPLLIFLADRAK